MATAETGSVTLAAQRVNISQPSVSAAIAELESRFGVDLFVRHHAQGLSLTAPGRTLLLEAKRLVEQAESFIRKRDYTGLSILCKNGDSCYARVMLTVANFMLRNPSAQFEEVREIASAEGGRQAGFLSRQISWLSDIGAVAPMLGLLGTVVGMMKTFFEIANGDFSGGKQRIDMAGGVAEALITTAGGLMLGIPAILAYVYFRSRVHKRVGDLEAAVTHSVSVVATQLQKPRAGAAGAFHEEELPRVPVDPTSLRDVRGL